MTRIYEREDFKDLPKWFWNEYNRKNTLSVISTSYPIIPIRIVISDKSEQDEAYTFLYNQNEKEKVKGTFISEFTDGDFYVGMMVNTIEYYITDKIISSKIDTLSYEEMLSCNIWNFVTIFKIGYWDGISFIERSTPCATQELAQKEIDELNFNSKINKDNKYYEYLPVVIRTE